MSRKRKPWLWCLVVALMVLPAAAHAARIELRDGSVLVGEVVDRDGGNYTLRMTNGTEIRIAARDVQRVVDTGLRIHGSNTIGERLMPALAEAYARSKRATDLEWVPGAVENEKTLRIGSASSLDLPETIEIAAHGSSTAFTALQERRADIGMSSRRIKESEYRELDVFAGTLVGNEHVLALDGLAIIVHPSNPLDGLPKPQIASLFAGRVTSWSGVGGAAGAVALNARDDKSGTFDSFKTMVLEPERLSLARTASRFESSTELSDGVAADPNRIGFIGLSYVREAKPLDILECGLSYAPTPFAVKSEDYPLARRLYLYTPSQPSSPYAQDLVEFALSTAGQEVVEKAGFVSLAVEASGGSPQTCRLEQALVSFQNRQALQDFVLATRSAERLSVPLRFETGESVLDSRARADLRRLAEYVRQPDNRGKRLLLFGFSDSEGDYQHNATLSGQRARVVADALERLGVHVDVVKGFGEEVPVACNDTEDGQAKNRRVEAWIR